jgi:hypothetical protein
MVAGGGGGRVGEKRGGEVRCVDLKIGLEVGKGGGGGAGVAKAAMNATH